LNQISLKLSDSPVATELRELVALWELPAVDSKLAKIIPSPVQTDFWELSSVFQQKLKSLDNIQTRSRLEKLILNWLYDFVRLNVIRGRTFDLREVLLTGTADCLGYAKILTVLGQACGLDLGVIEVLIDNRGRVLPHTAVLARLADGRRLAVDLWYGSKDIHHRRLGLQVKRAGRWQIEDIDYKDIKAPEDISWLPARAVNAVTLYIEGNRSLKKGDYAAAVKEYTRALRLYPQNSRAYYNRAIGYEKLGWKGHAEMDYSRALSDANSLKRTAAVQPREIEDLLILDEKFVPELDQQIYLLSAGFITGTKVPIEQIARKLSLDPEEVEAVVGFMVRVMSAGF
jgi:tetratricopeptide (TPR) repeat protein